MAKILIFLGVGFIAAGILWHMGWLGWAGRLPGDIHIKKENFAFYFPITTCILISIVLTVLLKFFKRF